MVGFLFFVFLNVPRKFDHCFPLLLHSYLIIKPNFLSKPKPCFIHVETSSSPHHEDHTSLCLFLIHSSASATSFSSPIFPCQSSKQWRYYKSLNAIWSLSILYLILRTILQIYPSITFNFILTYSPFEFWSIINLHLHYRNLVVSD